MFLSWGENDPERTTNSEKNDQSHRFPRKRKKGPKPPEKQSRLKNPLHPFEQLDGDAQGENGNTDC